MADIVAEPGFGGAFAGELQRLFRLRRDVRQFRRDALPDGLIERLLAIACLAPSVGLSQPWRFVVVADAARRAAVRASFLRCNAAAQAGYADARAASYGALKLAGLDDAPCHVAVFAEPDPDTGYGLGRQTMPETLAYSAVMAIHTLWLAARAEGVGLGWVSIIDPVEVGAALDVPASWRFIGYLCIGYPRGDGAMPELERLGWEMRLPAKRMVLQR